MLVHNMVEVVTQFFTGAKTCRIKQFEDRKGMPQVEQSLQKLEKKGIINSRVRPDTKVKQYHALSLFEYLKKTIVLKENQMLLVLTNADLYPKEGWTFVFGMTKTSFRICIQSYARHHPSFPNTGDKEK